MKINEALTFDRKRGIACFRGIKKSLVSVFYVAAIICTTATIWTSVCKYLAYPSRNVVRETESVSKRDMIKSNFYKIIKFDDLKGRPLKGLPMISAGQKKVTKHCQKQVQRHMNQNKQKNPHQIAEIVKKRGFLSILIFEALYKQCFFP